MSERPGEISVRFRLTYAHIKELSDVFVSRHGWYSKLTKWHCYLGLLLWAGIILFGVDFALGEGWIGRAEARSAIWGAALGYLALIFFAVVQSALARGLWTRELAARPETHNVLNEKGVSHQSEHFLEQIEWECFLDIAERSSGLILYFGSGRGIFVPDDALPSGVNRQEVLRRIAIWRGGVR